MMLRVMILACVALSPVPCGAQGFRDKTWFFRERGYYESLIAEPRGAMIHVLALARSDEVPFVTKPGARRVWDISLGKEIPIWGYQSTDITSTPLAKGKWGFGVWAPISFHMMEDFKDDSNPILNTDYRFAGMLKAQRGIANDVRIGFKFQAGHESTHLGDEFTIAAERREPGRFLRVNVSYEYWEYGVSLEGESGKHRWTFRHGGIGLLDPRKGFYSEKLLFPDTRTIAASKRNFEPSIGLEWKWIDEPDKWRPFASLDTRFRTIYDYAKPAREVGEDSQASFNLLFGVHRTGGYLQRGLPHFYLRLYHGVNPHGQFRSQRDYTLIGVGMYIPL